MAKLKKDFAFKNAEVDFENGLIHEYGKNDETVETFSINDIFEELSTKGRLDFTINASSTLAPVEE